MCDSKEVLSVRVIPKGVSSCLIDATMLFELPKLIVCPSEKIKLQLKR